MDVVNSQKRVSLTIEDHVIRYIVSSNGSKGLVYHSYGERYLPAGLITEGKIVERETLSMILEECISDWKLRGKRALFTVPDPFVVVRRVEVDGHVPDYEVKGHLYLELGETLHLPFDEPIFDTSIIGQTDEKKDVLLVGAPENLVNDYKELLQEVKLKPIAADLTALSFYRFLYHVDLVNRDDHLLTLQLTVDSMNITIFHKHVPIFTRHVRLNLDGGIWDINRDIELGDQLYWNGEEESVQTQLTDALSELDRVMSFYRFSLTKGKDQVTKLSITGDHPHLDRFIQSCKNTFNLGIHNLHNVELIAKNGQAIPTRYHELIGLSLK